MNDRYVTQEAARKYVHRKMMERAWRQDRRTMAIWAVMVTVITVLSAMATVDFIAS